jgi:hypothetical protein
VFLKIELWVYMSAIAVTFYLNDAGTRTFYFEKNTKDKPLRK